MKLCAIDKVLDLMKKVERKVINEFNEMDQMRLVLFIGVSA